MADMSASNTRQISTSVAASVSRGTALQASLTRALAGVNSTMIASVASKADEDKHMWLGGCSGSGGCWSDRCLDRVELDTARPKFYKYELVVLLTGASMRLSNVRAMRSRMLIFLKF